MHSGFIQKNISILRGNPWFPLNPSFIFYYLYKVKEGGHRGKLRFPYKIEIFFCVHLKCIIQPNTTKQFIIKCFANIVKSACPQNTLYTALLFVVSLIIHFMISNCLLWMYFFMVVKN